MSEENERLREQVAKQESMVSSIQDGNKFLQEQTRVLTQEVQEAKKKPFAWKRNARRPRRSSRRNFLRTAS